MSTARAINSLPAWARTALFQGRCPYCHQHAFIRHEWQGLSATLLCPGCYREYHVGVAVAELLHSLCPASRLKTVYGLADAVVPSPEIRS